MAKQEAGLPDVNALVRVSMTAIDEPVTEGTADDVASRIEDLTRDEKTGKILDYLIAMPRFVGNVVLPEVGAECSLNWHSPLGLWMLPTAFQSQETTGYGRVWRLSVTGAARRDQRRQYVRVPWSLTADLEIRQDLHSFDPHRRQLLERSGLLEALPDLPSNLQGRALNLSEGGMLCMTGGPVLPSHLPLIARFTLDSTTFVIPASVVWSLERDDRAQLGVENALAFDDPGVEGDALRPLLFQAQLKARRAGLI
jgi:PilZ domain-containing protein